uniref:Uncharacterized protein n=1 Tax=Rhizophora mucronata TaxID=61149 RepID=A0A2P2NIV1_RHIMU
MCNHLPKAPQVHPSMVHSITVKSIFYTTVFTAQAI